MPELIPVEFIPTEIIPSRNNDAMSVQELFLIFQIEWLFQQIDKKKRLFHRGLFRELFISSSSYVWEYISSCLLIKKRKKMIGNE